MTDMQHVFKILARYKNKNCSSLVKLLSPLGDVEIIEDVNGGIEGCYGMTGKWRMKTTAWDILFRDLDEKYTWIIEDDVAMSQEAINKVFNHFKDKDVDLIAKSFFSEKEYPTWGWWAVNDYFDKDELCHSLNCFCRISPRLIKYVKQYKKENDGVGLFHEILFPVLAGRSKESLDDGIFSDYFKESSFSWDHSKVSLSNPDVHKFYHPVKGAKKHFEICNLK